MRARSQRERSPLNELTAREREMLSRDRAEGKSNAAIAESLFLTKRAVEKHINAIFLEARACATPRTSAAASRPP